MATFKKLYTQDEVMDVIRWAEAHKSEFPKEMQLYPSTFLPDVSTTIDNLSKVLSVKGALPTYAGEMFLMLEICERVGYQMPVKEGGEGEKDE